MSKLCNEVVTMCQHKLLFNVQQISSAYATMCLSRLFTTFVNFQHVKVLTNY